MEGDTVIQRDRSTDSFGLDGTNHELGYHKTINNRNNTCRFSSTVVVVLAVQIVVILFIYPIVIGIVVLNFQSEISRLEMSIQHMKDRQSLQQPASDPVDEKVSDWLPNGCNCPGQELGNPRESTQDTTGLLSCCVADSETVRKLISDVVQEDLASNRNKQRSGHVSVRTIERIVQDVIRRNNRTSRGLPQMSVRPSVQYIGAHVIGHEDGFVKNKQIRFKRGMFKVGPWEYERGQSFSVDVGVDSHHMVVPENGIYYIYSQVYFRDERQEQDRRDLSVDEFLHYTVQDSTAYTPQHTDLMKSGRTKELDGGAENGYYFSSYHSGMFKLRRGDKIYMKVFLQHEDIKIDSSQDSTFMGMYLVSDYYPE